MPAGESGACAYCGAVLTGGVLGAGGGDGGVAARFRSLREHGDLPGLLAYEPAGAQDSRAGRLLPVILFTGVAGWLAVRLFERRAEASVLLLLVAGLLVVRAVVRSREAGAPVRRQPALVVDDRTVVQTAEDDTRARTSHHLTLEFEDGRREELRARGRVAGLLAAGDMGVAYTKGRSLVEFRRVRV